jgi:cell division transport system permease protein
VTILRAFVYFLEQALREMRRGWKVSLLAVFVTAASLFLGGLFALLGGNLSGALEGWEAQARVVVLLAPETPPDAVAAIEKELDRPFVERRDRVTAVEAQERLRARFPDLEELLEELDSSPLPESFEIELVHSARYDAEIESWLAGLRDLPGVANVDDDRVWIRQLTLVARLLRVGAGLIGGLLLTGSVFIITSVIRLAALVHREEIRVLRLVGATEFFVKGPFVIEGVLQGLIGAVLALGGLYGTYVVMRGMDLPELVTSTLLRGFLPVSWQLAVLLIGACAGLVGGLLSLRRAVDGLWQG